MFKGDRVIITNNYKDQRGTTGIVLKITSRYVRIGTVTEKLISKRKKKAQKIDVENR